MDNNFDEALLLSQRVDESFDEPILHQVLRIAIYDEYHAYETYRKVIDRFGAMPPFTNIMEAEVRHFSALEPLLMKYEVPLPVNDWYEKIEIPNTILECCEVGVAAEIDNIRMYDHLLHYVGEYPDIQDIFYRLQAASYNNHLPAFRRCVVRHSALQNPAGVNPSGAMPNLDSEEMMQQMNEFSKIAQKLASGQMKQEDIFKLLGQTNISFVGGVLLGALGAIGYNQFSKNKES